MSFSPLVLSDTLGRQSYEQPMPVQAQSIPFVLTARGLLARAQTGTGKTIQRLLPAPLEEVAVSRPDATRDWRPSMTLLRGVTEDPAAIIAALHELIEALDRRIPDITRVGEAQISEQAADLRQRAILRIEQLTRDTTRH